MSTQMRDSGIEWIGMIPKYWGIIRLERIFSKKPKKIGNLNLPTISLSFGKVVNKKGEVLEETHAAYQEVKIDNILVNPLNLNFDLKSLRIGISKIHGCASSGYIVLKIKKDNPNFFNYLLHVFDILEMKNMGGGVRQTVSFEQLKKINLILPPIFQQTNIANYLNHYTAKTDREISLINKKINLLEEYKQSLIYECVTKGLDKNVEMKDSGIEWIGMIPKYWGVKRLKSVLNINKGDIFNEDTVIENGIYPYINGGTKPSAWGNSYNTNPNTIAVSEGGASAGFSQLMKTRYWAGTHCYKINTKSGHNIKYFYYVLKGFEKLIMSEKTGSAMPNLQKTKFINYIVPFTKNKDEQQQIANYLDKETSKIDRQIELLEKKTILLDEYRRSLIYECVTGKKDID